MKRLCVCLLVGILVLSTAAIAEQPASIADSLFLAAKSAVVDMANGDFEQAAARFDVIDNAVTADSLRTLAEELFTLDPETVQSDISVAYWNGGKWLLAVPVTTPESDDVEAFLFSVYGDASIDGCAISTWGEVKIAYETCEYVVWNKEYVAQNVFVFAD